MVVKIDADVKIGADTSGDRVHGTRHSSSADRNFGYADFVTKAVALLTVLTAAAFASLRTPGRSHTSTPTSARVPLALIVLMAAGMSCAEAGGEP
jgi:hypothetical protein|tara:strand:+ start:64 stop:348 length:285 start_codon:yes stop_codon:yes gene_type:complete